MVRFIFITLAIILLLVGVIIVQSNNLNLMDSEGKKQFSSLYGGWIVKSLKNVKNIIGYSILQDWGVNETNSTE